MPAGNGVTTDFWLGTLAGTIFGMAAGLLMRPSQQSQAERHQRELLELEARKLRALEEQNRLIQEQ